MRLERSYFSLIYTYALNFLKKLEKRSYLTVMNWAFSFSYLFQCITLVFLGCPKINFLGTEIAWCCLLNSFSFSVPLSKECLIL